MLKIFQIHWFLVALISCQNESQSQDLLVGKWIKVSTIDMLDGDTVSYSKIPPSREGVSSSSKKKYKEYLFFKEEGLVDQMIDNGKVIASSKYKLSGQSLLYGSKELEVVTLNSSELVLKEIGVYVDSIFIKYSRIE